jgi:hypothetical protein
MHDMRFVGLDFIKDHIKMAVFSKKNTKYQLERLETIVLDEFVKEKNTCYITGLEADEVVCRDLHVKLRKISSLHKALPFQLEGVIPFPSEKAVIHPIFFPVKDGTDVVIFATTGDVIASHLERCKYIDPQIVSSVPIALSRWARFVFPKERSIALINEKAAIVLEGERVVFSQAFEERLRMELVFKQKFSHSFIVSDTDGPSCHQFSYQQLRAYAVSIGLAIDGMHKNGCQWRQGEFTSSVRKDAKVRFRRIMIASFAALLFLTIATGSWIVYRKTNQLQQRIPKKFSSVDTSMEKKIFFWEKDLKEQAILFPLLPSVPAVKDILGWLSQHNDCIEIVNFDYSLIGYPRIDDPTAAYILKIELEFTADSLFVAKQFVEKIKRNPSFIDKTKKIEWLVEEGSYKICFETRKLLI